MKTAVGIALLALALGPAAPAQTKGEEIVNFIASVYSHRAFSEAEVSARDVELILECGIKAPSARNQQPWRFTVVRDPQLMKKLIADAKPGNVIIVVSGQEKGAQATSVSFDCGLATQNMYVAAQALGLGSHMYTGPVANVNANLRKPLGIPDGFAVVALLKIGVVERKADATSAASARKTQKELVNFR